MVSKQTLPRQGDKLKRLHACAPVMCDFAYLSATLERNALTRRALFLSLNFAASAITLRLMRKVSRRFDCPNCGAIYRVIRAEAGPETMDREISCRSCGGPLRGREGRFVLKYFLVERPRVQALGRVADSVTRLS